VIAALAILVPLLAATLLVVPRMRGRVLAFTPWIPLAALPAVLAPPSEWTAGFLLLELRFGVEGWARPLLAGSAAIWACAGWALRAGRVSAVRLVAWHLTLAGNLGALTVLDEPGFYFFFAMLSIGAYGVIVHNRAARSAGALYLAVALFAELLLLAGLMLLALDNTGPAAALLMLFGLGAKLGVLPLHFPLPPAYASSDAAGAAVFGGALTLAAVAGWLRFMPAVGEQPELAVFVVGAGFAAAFLGAVAGSLQRDPRGLLGYSTVSQMGILTVGLGLALNGATPMEVAPLALFALHHGMSKAALLLGTGAGGRWVLALAVLLSLALAGAPLTGGAVAKAWLESIGGSHAPLTETVHRWLPFTSAATFVLMARFVWLLRHSAEPGRKAPALTLALIALAAPWIAVWHLHPTPLELVKVWSALWPLLLGAGLLALGWPLRGILARWRLPLGDVAVLQKPVARWLKAAATAWGAGHWPTLPRLDRFAPARLERGLRGLSGTGLVLLGLILSFAALLVLA